MTGSASDAWNRARRLSASRMIVTALFLAVCAIPLQAGMLRAQRHERRHQIDHLEEVWRNAVLKDDTAAMSSLLADDFIAITPAGTLQTKDEALANLRSGRTHVTTLEVSDRKVRFYGTTAVVTSTADVEGTTPEGNLSGSYRYTRVYARDQQGAWKIVSFEANRILEPGERR
jgi:ketosteroid isomerase-like protein